MIATRGREGEGEGRGLRGRGVGGRVGGRCDQGVEGTSVSL